MKRALVLGPGQDGSYLAEILLERGYDVHVMHRRSSVNNLHRIQHIRDRVTLHRGDLTDFGSMLDIFTEVNPDEVYNEADQDDVGWSRHIPLFSWEVTAGGPMRVLELVRICCPYARVFQPCSATMFGTAPAPQNEQTPFNPQSPFACAKVAAYHLCRHYRESYGLFVSTAILYNHDSPTRSEDYVLHKICKSAVRIARGEQKCLTLGSLSQRIDIGFARDYMEAAHDLLQLVYPDDFVIGSGVAWSLLDMVEHAFRVAGGPPVSETTVKIDPSCSRPGPQPELLADSLKANRAFGFKPQTGIAQLIEMLVEHEQGVK